MGDTPWSHRHSRKKQLILQKCQSPFVHSSLFLSVKLLTFAPPPLVCTEADFKGLEDLKSCYSTPPRQLENNFQNLQLGHFTLTR